jgi:hypothetical protein
MENKVDLKKQYKQFYNPSSKEPVMLDIPQFQYLTIEGQGTTKSESFQEAIKALFSVSYKTKFIIKKEKSVDYGVMPLEGLWWADDMNDFINDNRSEWKWILMIMQPGFVEADTIQSVIELLSKKEGYGSLKKLKLQSFTEGHAAQIMHIGPFSEEHENIMKLHRLIEMNHFKFDGKMQKHHEIYLSDFRKVAPEKMKTILRQPFIQ